MMCSIWQRVSILSLTKPLNQIVNHLPHLNHRAHPHPHPHPLPLPHQTNQKAETNQADLLARLQALHLLHLVLPAHQVLHHLVHPVNRACQVRHRSAVHRVHPALHHLVLVLHHLVLARQIRSIRLNLHRVHPLPARLHLVLPALQAIHPAPIHHRNLAAVRQL